MAIVFKIMQKQISKFSDPIQYCLIYLLCSKYFVQNCAFSSLYKESSKSCKWQAWDQNLLTFTLVDKKQLSTQQQYWYYSTLLKKWSFPLTFSSVNVTKSTGNWEFGRICWRSPYWKILFFVQCNIVGRYSPLWTNLEYCFDHVIVGHKRYCWSCSFK